MVPAERSLGDADVPGIHGATGTVVVLPEDVVPVLVVVPVPVVGALHLLS